jgi:hypothetical protein
MKLCEPWWRNKNMAKVFTRTNWIELLRQGKSIYSYAELMRLTKLSAPALFMHGIVDQAPHIVHCATLNKTKSFPTALGEIAYFHIKTDLFFGYGAQDRMFLAAPAKAALDFVYIQRQNGLAPSLDEWSWNHLDRSRLQDMLSPYPATVKKHLARFM